jgi:hypothetical protein
MHLQTTVVVNEAELSEFVHEEVHSGAGGANHLRQSLLAQLWDDGFGLIFFSETGQYQKRSGQTFLAGIEKLINQVCLRAVVTIDHISYKEIRQLVLLVQRGQHRFLLNSQDCAVRHGSSGCQADSLIGSEASLAQEVTRAEQSDGCFLTLLGEHGQPHSSFLNVEHRVRPISLGKDGLFVTIAAYCSADAGLRQKCIRIERFDSILDTVRPRWQPAKRWHGNSSEPCGGLIFD